MHSLLVALAVATSLMGAKNDKPVPPKVRVLIVTGVDHPAHAWKLTAPALRDVLESDKRLEARIVEDPEFLASPAVADYDVVLLHFMNPQPLRHSVEARENLAKFVKQGKGLVVLHFACGALAEWPEFADLAGKVWDRKTTHDPRGPYTVRITNTQHPITQGMKDFQADDELYFCLTGQRPVDVLAVARSKTNGKDQPMAFVFDYGKGRVFHSPLGHDAKSLRMPGVAELLQRGCLWVAGR
jgi:type 1 glutamine amidotransferase